MKNLSIESIRSGLVSQLEEIDHDLQNQQAQLNELKSTRRQVAAAIKALGGTDAMSGNNKPAPKKKQVQQAVNELLADNSGEIIAEDLEALVAGKLSAEQGCSAMGLALRMREVLSSGDYVTTDGNVQLQARSSRQSI